MIHTEKQPYTASAFMGGQGAKARTIAYSMEKSPCIKSVPSGGNTVPDVVYPINAFGNEVVCAIASTCANAEMTDGSISPSLLARAGTGGNQLPIICQRQGPDRVYQNTGRGWWNESEVCETIRTPCGGDAMKANLVVEVVE